MTFYEGRATITEGDIEATITCELHEHRQMIDMGDGTKQPGQRSWDGTWSSVEPEYPDLMRAGVMTIRLPDGRTGQVIITSTHMGSGGSYGTLTGTGPKPA